jgi:imidazolonepropionase-like amidohydrolase
MAMRTVPLGFAVLLSCVIGLLLLPADGPGQGEAAAEGDTFAFVGVDLLPMDRPLVLRDQTVVVQGGRIAATGPRSGTSVPKGARSIEGRGHYLVPGLADMHVHLEHFETPAYLQLFLVYGVTSVRSMDGRPHILDWKRQAESGALPSPSIYTAGPLLDGDPPVRPDNTVVRNAQEARNAVNAQADAGYDFIKIHSNLSQEAFSAIVTAASERRLPFAGHVPRAVGLSQILASGITSIEHQGDYADAIERDDSPLRGQATHWSKRRLAMPADPAKMERLATEIARSGVWSVPTVVNNDRALAPAATVDRWLSDPVFQAMDRGILSYWKGTSERARLGLAPADWQQVEQGRATRRALVGAFHRAGVKLAAGTDAPNPFVFPGLSLHEELANLVEAGLTPMEALIAATRDAARLTGQEKLRGTIEVGKRADLLLLSADPSRDIAATRAIAGVMVNGRWLAASDLQAMKTAVEQVAANSK